MQSCNSTSGEFDNNDLQRENVKIADMLNISSIGIIQDSDLKLEKYGLFNT